MATYAIVDADLLASCPPQLIAANGMDALTQLLEAFVSTRSNPLTDALALSGIQAAVEGLLPWYEGDPVTAILGREKMAYAALMSGICLAQTGLGSVHGLAQPLGSFFPIPHGVVCGTLLAAAVEVNVEAMQSRAPDHPALKKYAHVGRLILHRPALEDTHALAGLVEVLKQWTVRLQLPTLSALGVRASDFRRIVDHSRGSSMKTNPVVLDDAEIERIIRQRLN
jgi:alcohol dehydrogenase